MSAPDAKILTKLSAICARLASYHAGERAASALLATRILADAGITWADVIARAFEPRVSSPQRAQRFYRTPDKEAWLDVLRELLAQTWLNAWERNFLTGLLAKNNRKLGFWRCRTGPWPARVHRHGVC